MNVGELLIHCEHCLATNGHIAITSEVLSMLDKEGVDAILLAYGTRELLQLPEHEIAFFEWLRVEDPEVWNDLWETDIQAPYLVSLAHLYDFVGARQGEFAIRDLRSVDNYYFAPEMLIEKESTAFIQAVRDRSLSKQALSPAQVLALEASIGPVDIWHLAYRRNLPILTLKLAVRQLTEDRILVHVPDADHLAVFFDVQ